MRRGVTCALAGRTSNGRQGRVLIREGSYRLTQTVELSGEEHSYVTYAAYPGKDVEVTGIGGAVVRPLRAAGRGAGGPPLPALLPLTCAGGGGRAGVRIRPGGGVHARPADEQERLQLEAAALRAGRG